MIVANGSTDVTTYFVLRDSTNHAPKTDVTITDIDLYYLEQGAAMAAKVDATALDAADSAHADNKAYHTGQGLYRIDWPDEAFNGGVGKRVYLIVVCTGVDTTFLEVELSPNVNTNSLTADVITADKIADNAFANEHFANGALTSTEITSAAGCVVASIANDAITAASIATDAITDDAIATGAIASTAFAAGAIDDTAVADNIKVDVNTIKGQAITCAAGVTVLASVGTAATSTAQTGDSYAIVNGDHGLVSIQDDVDAIKLQTDKLTFEAVTNHIEAAVQNIAANAITATSINADAIEAAKIKDDAITAAKIAAGAIDAATFAANAITSTVIADDAITAAKLNTGAITADAFAANAIEAAAIKDGAITNAKVADDVDVNVKTITAGAIAAASLNADMDAELATIIWNAAVASYGGAGTYGQAVEDILADTNELQVDDTPTAVAAVKTVVDAVKVQTDKLTFTVANQVDANIQYINDTAVTGDGGATPWGPA